MPSRPYDEMRGDGQHVRHLYGRVAGGGDAPPR
jgi:hypothetical protein